MGGVGGNLWLRRVTRACVCSSLLLSCCSEAGGERGSQAGGGQLIHGIGSEDGREGWGIGKEVGMGRIGYWTREMGCKVPRRSPAGAWGCEARSQH